MAVTQGRHVVIREEGVPILDQAALDQAALDQEDAAHRLRLLVECIECEREAEERVSACARELARAKSALKNARRRRQELAFLERKRGRGKA